MSRSSKKKPRAQRVQTQGPARETSPQGASPFGWRNRRDLKQLSIVLAAALALRLLFFFLNKANNPVFHNPIVDALFHHEWAIDILEGPTPGDDVFYRAPFYPYMLAVLYRLSDSSIAFAIFFQHLLGTMTCGLVYLLSREYFSRNVALIAGLGAALYWPFVYYEGELLIVTTFLFLNAVSLLFFAKALKGHSLKWFAAAGFVLGVSTITRPSILVFFPVVPLSIWLSGRGSTSRRTSWAKCTGAVAAAALISIGPVMVRNWHTGRAIVPIAASGGVNFYIGNNPLSDGSSAILPGARTDFWGGYQDAVDFAERDRARALSLSEVSDYYFERGTSFMVSRPGEAWTLMLKKLRLFWAAPERSNFKFIYFFWHMVGMKYVPLPGFWLVAPLGLLGMFSLWPRRRELSMFYLFIVTYMVGVVAFFVNARFRLPVVPLLIMFGAYGAVHLISGLKEKRAGSIPALAVLLAAAVLVNSGYAWFDSIRAYQTAASHLTLGTAYLEKGMRDTALRHFEEAEAINERTPSPSYKLIESQVNYNIGRLLYEQGRTSRAIEALKKVTGTDAMALTALDYLGDCYLGRNDVRKAAAAFQRIRQIDENDPRGMAGIARCHAKSGNLEEAERILEAIVDPTRAVYPPAYIALADVQRARGKTMEAIQSYANISHYAGYEKQALITLAELYDEVGDQTNALATLERARNYFSPDDPTVDNMVRALRDRR